MTVVMRSQERPALFLILLLIFLAGISCSTGPSIATAEAADGKVGFINLKRLMRESQMGQKARADLSLLREKKQKEVDRQGGIVKQLREELNTRSQKMSEAETKQKAEHLQGVYKDYQRLVADAKEDIQREDRELVATILKAADGILKDVAKKKKFSIILKDPDVIGYLDPEVDITDDVLKALNQRK